MKKTYYQPHAAAIEVKLFGSVMAEGGPGIGSQPADDSIVFSKGNNYNDIDDDPWETEAPSISPQGECGALK